VETLGELKKYRFAPDIAYKTGYTKLTQPADISSKNTIEITAG